MIPKANIQRLAVKLTSDGKSISEQTLEKDYVLSWILMGLTFTDLGRALLFKGGTALKKFYIKGFRFSEDLDFTLTKMVAAEEIVKSFDQAFQKTKEMANIELRLARQDLSENNYTFYINYTGPLGADISKRDIKIDVSFNEKVLFPAKNKKLIKEYEEYHDLPYDLKVMVYDEREIFIEKLCCLATNYRNEPRDIYDLWHLLTQSELVEAEMLIEDFKNKLKYKSLDKADLNDSLSEKEGKYKSEWHRRLKDQMFDLPEFNLVYRELKQRLRLARYI